MKYTAFAFCLLFVCGSAFAGGLWQDNFDQYANQVEFEAGGSDGFNADKDWDAFSGSASWTDYVLGKLDDTNHFIGTKSMRCERTPAETRPRHAVYDGDKNATQGYMAIFIYDDGADLKEFEVQLLSDAAGTSYVALGLHDDQVGTSTNYIQNVNGTITDTGIPRKVGWHYLQFSVKGDKSGTNLYIDNKEWGGNFVSTFTQAYYLVINVGFGTADNKIWVDYAKWEPYEILEDDKEFPTNPWMEYTFEKFTTNADRWASLPEAETLVTHITDDGYHAGLVPENLGCVDFYDFGGLRGVRGTFAGSPALVPITGRYQIFGYFMNGPEWPPTWSFGEWENLTVTVNGATTSVTNLGSDEVTGWYNPWAEPPYTPQYEGLFETDGFWLVEGQSFTVEITGSNDDPNCLVRFDEITLNLLDFTDPPTATPTNTPFPTPTISTGVGTFEVYE